jgi:hypothetical protein
MNYLKKKLDILKQKYITEEIFIHYKEINSSDDLRKKYKELTKKDTILTNKQIS